jgi:hypothetical protein
MVTQRSLLISHTLTNRVGGICLKNVKLSDQVEISKWVFSRLKGRLMRPAGNDCGYR